MTSHEHVVTSRAPESKVAAEVLSGTTHSRRHIMYIMTSQGCASHHVGVTTLADFRELMELCSYRIESEYIGLYRIQF